MFRLPDLSQTPFYRFRGQIDVDFADYVPEVAAELTTAFAGQPFAIEGIDRESYSQHHSISVEISPLADSISIAFDIRVTASFEASWEEIRGILEGLGESSPHLPTFVTARAVEVALGERLASLNGIEDASIEVVLSFEVDPEHLPSDGIIRRGLGARAPFGDDVLQLAGAKFAINVEDLSDGVQNTVSWFIEPDCFPSRVLGSIEFRGEKHLTPTVFSEIINQSLVQFQRYILETKETAVK